MNKFQKEIQRRKREALKLVGLGNISHRLFVRWVRDKLKKDIKGGLLKF